MAAVNQSARALMQNGDTFEGTLHFLVVALRNTEHTMRRGRRPASCTIDLARHKKATAPTSRGYIGQLRACASHAARWNVIAHQATAFPYHDINRIAPVNSRYVCYTLHQVVCASKCTHGLTNESLVKTVNLSTLDNMSL